MAPKKSGSWQLGNYQSGSTEGSKLNDVELPARIKCATCRKNFLQARYSNRQLALYQGDIKRNGIALAKNPSCRDCSSGQRTELTCSWCDVTKGLEAFSKAQRRNADKAKCLDCQQDIADLEPNPEEALEEERIKEELSGIGVGTISDIESSISGFSAAGSSVGSSASVLFRKGTTTRDGVWIPPDSASSARSDEIVSRVSQNLEGHGRRSSGISSASSEISDFKAPGAASSGWAPFTQAAGFGQPLRQVSSRTSSSNSGQMRGSNPGFARQGAEWRKQDPLDKVTMQHHREEKRRQEAMQNLSVENEEEDSDGSDWEM